MKIVAISDVHSKWEGLKIPECDLLISAGDYSFVGEARLVNRFHKWLSQQPAKRIISLQGNHEREVECAFSSHQQTIMIEYPQIDFIAEGPLEYEHLKIWCSAWTPKFYNWAWMKPRGEAIKKHWDAIADDTELLITHGPPCGILDTVNSYSQEHLGCEELAKRVLTLPKLRAHVFGHIHGGYGETKINGVRFINASICDESYRAKNAPIELEL